MPHITVNGTRLHYTDTQPQGTTEQETVVFAHGLLWGGWMFEPQVEALAAQYRCITFDFRGQGQSEITRDGYDMESLTDDAAALIAELGVAPCHFAGLSMGGFVALRLAIHRPELLRSLILLETSADPEPRENVPRYRMLNFIARWFGLGLVASQVMPIMFGRSFLTDPSRAEERQDLRRRLVANHRIGISRAVRGVIERRGVAESLGRIDLPTLVVVGDQDVATVPAKAERIHRDIRGSQLVVVPEAGHTSTLEEPAAVNRALRDFLSSLDSPS